jgi:hypothetical protein
MKTIVSNLNLMFCISVSCALTVPAQAIASGMIKNRCETVVGIAPKDSVHRNFPLLAFGSSYPRETLRIEIRSEKVQALADSLVGRKICVTGYAADIRRTPTMANNEVEWISIDHYYEKQMCVLGENSSLPCPFPNGLATTVSLGPVPQAEEPKLSIWESIKKSARAGVREGLTGKTSPQPSMESGRNFAPIRSKFVWMVAHPEGRDDFDGPVKTSIGMIANSEGEGFHGLALDGLDLALPKGMRGQVYFGDVWDFGGRIVIAYVYQGSDDSQTTPSEALVVVGPHGQIIDRLNWPGTDQLANPNVCVFPSEKLAWDGKALVREADADCKGATRVMRVIRDGIEVERQ